MALLWLDTDGVFVVIPNIPPSVGPQFPLISEADWPLRVLPCIHPKADATIFYLFVDALLMWFPWQPRSVDHGDTRWLDQLICLKRSGWKKLQVFPLMWGEKRGESCVLSYIIAIYIFFKVMTEKCKNISLLRVSFVPPRGNSIHSLWCCETRCEGAFFSPFNPLNRVFHINAGIR